MDRHKHPHFNSAVHLLLLTIFTALQTVTWGAHAIESPSPKELLIGFKATPDPSISSFQPLLFDESGNYSLGFLRVDPTHLSLSVLHVPSSVPVWSANTTRLPIWTDPTQLSFNGSLVLSDSHTGVFWSTDTIGDRVWLSNTSNLIVQKLDGETVLWQSFDLPSDTLVENQNFTTAMALVSLNGLYSMRLGPDYVGLYAKFGTSAKCIGYPPGQTRTRWKSKRVLLDRVELGIDYQAISEPCELPSSCGSYGLCKPGKECSCLENRTVYGSSGCGPLENRVSGDFCGAYENRFRVLRRSGVELPFKELMGYRKMASIEMCEGACEGNCTCWGVVYSNSSGFCYMLDYPIQTLVAVGDETKTGYFKVREGVGKKKVDAWLGLGLGLFFGAVLVFAGVLGLGWYKLRNRGVKGYVEEEGVVGIGPYKDLGAASFRSIELCER
ncbi:hypothetical protein DH2020_007830 [Rehmannia glutinosa]|uniref:Uncharacterized protein n=1 Tax=Rehmannia glutinosa TaxID=99300 RepID=A0ABR0TZS5_REHGL